MAELRTNFYESLCGNDRNEEMGGRDARSQSMIIAGQPVNQLAVYPAANVDFIAFLLRDIERIAIRVEAAVLRHGTARRAPAETALRQ